MAVTDDAIERIKGMILDGELRPGDRLPREAELSAALGLSRNSLREAVRAWRSSTSSTCVRATAPTSPAWNRGSCSTP